MEIKKKFELVYGQFKKNNHPTTREHKKKLS